MKKMTSFVKNLWKDESGQGATEYIILLVVIVGVVLLFKDKIGEMVGGRLGVLGNALQQFTGDAANGGQ